MTWNIAAIVIAALIGAGAWVYQKAWDRQQQRIASYQQIVDHLPGFTVNQRNPNEVDAALREFRRLWIFAPDEVIRTGNAFIDTVRTGVQVPDEDKKRALAEFVLAMRRDATFSSALVPSFFRTALSVRDLPLDYATQPAPEVPQGSPP